MPTTSRGAERPWLYPFDGAAAADYCYVLSRIATVAIDLSLNCDDNAGALIMVMFILGYGYLRGAREMVWPFMA
jgi:hypothetical protein